MKIPLIRPYIPEEAKELLWEVLQSGMLSESKVTREYEAELKKYLKCHSVLATVNCTIGIEIALRAIGIGPGDEVIVPDYTYPATAQAVENLGGTPVIMDVDQYSMLIKYDEIESYITDRTKAIMPVSLFGNALDYSKLSALKEKTGLLIIEDAACALGSEYDGIKTGNHADIAIFSSHPRKFITTGEGGFITTNNEEYAKWMDSFKHFGMHKGETIEFVQEGTNGKVSDILSAVGLAQVRIIEELSEKRRAQAERYRKLLSGKEGIELSPVTENSVHSYQTFIVFIENRDAVRKSLRDSGIEVQIGTYALHTQPAFRKYCEGKEFPGSAYAYNHSLALPMYYEMPDEEQEIVVERLCKQIEIEANR